MKKNWMDSMNFDAFIPLTVFADSVLYVALKLCTSWKEREASSNLNLFLIEGVMMIPHAVICSSLSFLSD